ncbi:DUF6233 domain-containing protein [Streptomyces sp. NBC_01477]
MKALEDLAPLWARTVLTRPDAAPCAVCRPDRPLGTAAA